MLKTNRKKTELSEDKTILVSRQILTGIKSYYKKFYLN